MNIQIVEDINNIVSFLSRRDISELSERELEHRFGIKQVDMIIILGSSIPYIAELGAKAYKEGLSKELMIAGGIGHSTKYLIENILEDSYYKDVDVNNLSEADILKQVIVKNENINPKEIIIENKSTNCGANAYESLKILKERDKFPQSIVLIQDPTMQLRSHASFMKEWNKEKSLIISYSPFVPLVKLLGEEFEYVDTEIRGLWSKDRLIDLIMGEIPRLRDDKNGYGPKGKGFIDHVDIPTEVLVSYKKLLGCYSEYINIKIRK